MDLLLQTWQHRLSNKTPACAFTTFINQTTSDYVQSSLYILISLEYLCCTVHYYWWTKADAVKTNHDCQVLTFIFSLESLVLMFCVTAGWYFYSSVDGNEDSGELDFSTLLKKRWAIECNRVTVNPWCVWRGSFFYNLCRSHSSWIIFHLQRVSNPCISEH